MSHDTRRDKRAKVVSLNVRYKSATVDEFIENHSHDVSQGGLFVKTQSPFASGTLLKFEIRIADDQPMIAGVGRVVWKREPSQATAERPAGMGVKFIKIDDASRVVIDRLISTKADAGSAYTSEDVPAAPTTLTGLEAAKPVDVAPPYRAPVAVPSPTATGQHRAHVPDRNLAHDSDAPTLARTGAAPAGLPAASSPPAQALRKSTVIGLGAVSSPPAATSGAPKGPALPSLAPKTPSGFGEHEATTRQATSPKALSGSPAAMMFPSGAPSAPVQEPTVIRQAAELLEEALKEAGGSLDEIGHNPLFSASGRPAAATPEQSPSAQAMALGDTLRGEHAPKDDTLVLGRDAMTPARGAPSAPPPHGGASATPHSYGSTPPPPGIAAAASKTGPYASAAAVSAIAPGAPLTKLSDQVARPQRSSGAGVMIALAAALVLLGGGATYAYKTGLLGAMGTTATPSAEPAPPPPPTVAPAASSESPDPSVASASASASDSPEPPVASAAPAASASAAPSAKPAAVAPPTAPPQAVAPKAVAPKPVAPKPVAPKLSADAPSEPGSDSPDPAPTPTPSPPPSAAPTPADSPSDSELKPTPGDLKGKGGAAKSDEGEATPDAP